MKRIVVCILLLLTISCERLEDLCAPYNYRWFITNNTVRDVTILTNVNEVSVIDGGPIVDNTYYSVPSGERYQIYGLSNEYPQYNFESFTNRLNFLIITTEDGAVVLKEFHKDVYTESDIYVESEWVYSERKEYITHDYYITHHEWTFTITDADIGVVE